MTKMLASVTGVEEAEIAIAGGADIIDLKDPTAGALGARGDRNHPAGRDLRRRTPRDKRRLRRPADGARNDPRQGRRDRRDRRGLCQDRLLPVRNASACADSACTARRADEADRRPVCRPGAGFRIAAGARQAWLSMARWSTRPTRRRGGCSTICRRSAFPAFVDRARSLGLMVGLERIARSA